MKATTLSSLDLRLAASVWLVWLYGRPTVIAGRVRN